MEVYQSGFRLREQINLFHYLQVFIKMFRWRACCQPKSKGEVGWVVNGTGPKGG